MVGQGFEREEGQVHGWVDVRLDMRYLYEKECKGGDGLSRDWNGGTWMCQESIS